MFEVHISKHSLFRLKITVGCLTSTYPSIHFFVSRSRSVVDCARVQAFTFLLTKTLSRSRSVVWYVVWCVCSVWCGVCVVVLWWCVCVVCVVCVLCGVGSLAPSLTLALALVLSLSLSLLSSFFPSTHSSLLFPSRQQTLYKALINKRGGI